MPPMTWPPPRAFVTPPLAVLALAASILFAAWKLDEHYITRAEFTAAMSGLERQLDLLSQELKGQAAR